MVGLLAATAAGLALALSLTVFAHFSSDHDEPVYVYQSEVLRSGHLTVPAATHDPFFRPWLHGERDGRLFSVFPPVWPALLAASRAVVGTERGMLAVDAAAAVVLAYLFTYELLRRRAPAVVVAGLLAVSPFFLVLAGTRLSYTMALVLDLGFGWSLLRAHRTGRWPWYVAAGAWWGVLAFARPLDAVMFGSVAAGALAVAALRSPGPPPGSGLRRGPGTRLRRLVAPAGLAAAGAAPPLLVGALYNTAVAGGPLRFPLSAAGGDNAYGFGLRQLAPGSPIVDFQPSDAWRALTHNLWFLPRWSPGSFLIVAVAAAGLVLLVREGRRGTALLLLATAAVVPLGNFPYWGNVFVVMGKRILGPHYYLTMLIPLLALAAVALVGLFRRSPLALGGLALAMVVATGLEVRPKLEINRNIACTNRQPLAEVERALAAAAASGDDAGGRALVFVPPSQDGPTLLHPFPELRNPPDLRARVLYSTTIGPRAFELAARYPDRALYRLGFRVPEDGNRRRRVPVVDRLRPVSGPTVRIPFEVANPGRRGLVRTYVTDGTHHAEAVLDEDSGPGDRLAGAWVLSPAGLTADVPGVPPGPPARWWGAYPTTIIVGVAFGAPGAAAERFETHFWVDGGADRVTVLAPGEAFHGEASAGMGHPVAEDVSPTWRVTGDIGEGRRFPRRDPCST
ncbi:MAG: glycosyltransferase family 39 protein [Acidimicrobiia bacterium]